MEGNGLRNVLKFLQRQALRQGTGLPDSALLERFVHSRDEAAFELLLWRHGPLVLNVCRRLLRNEHDVDDAFQATFSALACKARTIRRHSSAAPWLYKVAYRAALAARARSGRFLGLPPEVEPIAPTEDDLLWRDLRPVLDAEVQKLGEKYRSAFVLCYLQGLTHGEAAARLGCPEGTIHSRLSTAKEHLRRGLERRGVTLSGTGMALEFATRQIGAPPAVHLIQHTLTAAFSMAGSPLGGTVAKSSVVSLTKGVLFTMWMQSYTAPALVTLVLSLVGVGIVGFQGKAGTQAADEPGQGKIVQKAVEVSKPSVTQPPRTQADLEALRAKEYIESTMRTFHIDQAKATLFYQLEVAYNQLEREQEASLSSDSLRRSKYSQSKIEASLRMLEERIDFERDREKKLLGALVEDELRLDRAMRTEIGQADHRKAADLASAVQVTIKQKLAEIREKEEQRSTEIINTRVELEQHKRLVKSEEEKVNRDSAVREKLIAQIRSNLLTSRVAAQFPQIEGILKAKTEETRADRVANELDQVMRELTEVKKLLAKP